MGLDAFVRCNCLELGLTSDPPFPIEWLYFDDEGFLHIAAEHEDDERWEAMEEWKDNCCEHPDLHYVFERISNWQGYRIFQEAMEQIGLENFPVLTEELPNANDGQMSADSSAVALKELDRFREACHVVSNVYLVDTDTGKELYEHVAAYEGIFILRGSTRVGIGEYEFFIRDEDTGVDHFRAAQFEQILLDPLDEQSPHYQGRVEYRDLDSDRCYQDTIAISGGPIPWPDGQMQNDEGEFRYGYPKRFHVETRNAEPKDFEYILKPLTIVFRASVDTGNPVVWC